MLKKSRSESEETLKQARSESEELLKKAKEESSTIMEKSQKIEEKILEREEKIQARLDEIDKRQESLFQKEEELKTKRENLVKKEEELDGKLAEISKLTEVQAKELFIAQISEKYSQDGLTLIEKYKNKVEDQKKEIAREIILKSIQQFAGDVTNEVTTTIIELPSDDIKGKLIGKEGRNITTFEKTT